MDIRYRTAVLVVAVVFGPAAQASAQRLPFERSFDVSPGAVLDVSTVRGKIDVSVGEPGRVRIMGTVTVRVGLSLPPAALELARMVAADPPIGQEGSTIRLRPPAEGAERRAMTISYVVQVPRDMAVTTVSESGATTVSGVAGHVSVRTQSASIAVRNLGGSAEVTSGSGAVTVDGVQGDLVVSTASSAIGARGLGGALHARTQSGAVEASLVGSGTVDVRTGSSAVALEGVRGELMASSESGRIQVDGAPLGPWEISSGSGNLNLALEPAARLTLEARSRSGSVNVDAVLSGTTSKGRAAGTIGGGGPLVRCTSRSGSIRVDVAG